MASAPYRSGPRDTAEALFGAELRARRVRAGLSLRRLASLVFVSHDLLARIEKAQRRPQPDLIDRLDDVLRADGELWRLARPFTEDLARPSRPTELAPDNAASTLHGLLTRLRAADHTMTDGRADEIRSHLYAAEQVLVRLDSRGRNELRRAMAEAHQLRGWMSFDRGSLAAAEKAFAAARLVAEQAGASDLLAFVGGPNAGFMSVWSGDAARGAERAYAAMSWARRSGNHRLSAFVATMCARAHARLGEAELCTRMLVEAETELARHCPDEPDPVWLEVFDLAALAGHRGSCLLDLGHHDHAVRALREQAGASAPIFVRNRTIWSLEQAEAQLRLGDPESAAVAVNAAMDAIGDGAVSQRVQQMFRAVASTLDNGDPPLSSTRERLRRFNAACV